METSVWWGSLQGVKASQQMKSTGRSADAIFSDPEEILNSVCWKVLSKWNFFLLHIFLCGVPRESTPNFGPRSTKLVGTVRVTKKTHIVNGGGPNRNYGETPIFAFYKRMRRRRIAWEIFLFLWHWFDQMTDGWEERFAGEDLISGQAQLTHTTYSTFSSFSALECKEALFEENGQFDSYWLGSWVLIEVTSLFPN